MIKNIYLSVLAFLAVIILDQTIKFYFINGYEFYGDAFAKRGKYIDLILLYNDGVAFSLLSFLKGYLKYLQIALLIAIIAYVYIMRYIAYALPIAIFLGAGVSNVIDRFIHGGVVDYIFWHYGFDFAVFNLADVIINSSVAWILLLLFFKKRKREKIEIDK